MPTSYRTTKHAKASIHPHLPLHEGKQTGHNLLIEVLGHERAQNGCENAPATLIRHVSHGEHVKVAQQAVGDGVAATPRGTHGRHKLGVNDLLEGTWGSPFIPALQRTRMCSVKAADSVLHTVVFASIFIVRHCLAENNF